MTIGDLAKACGLRASAIRYYEQAGLLPAPRRVGGQRRYDGTAIERIAVLKFTRECGFTVAEARAFLNAFGDHMPLSKRLQGIAEDKIARLDAEARVIAAQKQRIRRALRCRCTDLRECGRRIMAARTPTVSR